MKGWYMRAMMRIGFGGVVVAAGMIAMSTGAAAVDDIVFTASGIVSGGEGEIRLLGEVTVAPELVGATCTGRAETAEPGLGSPEQRHDHHHGHDPGGDPRLRIGTVQGHAADRDRRARTHGPVRGSPRPDLRLERWRHRDPRLHPRGTAHHTGPADHIAPPDPPTTPGPRGPADHDRAVRRTRSHDRRRQRRRPRVPPSPAQERSRETGSSSGPAIFAATALIVAGVAMTLLRRRAAA